MKLKIFNEIEIKIAEVSSEIIPSIGDTLCFYDTNCQYQIAVVTKRSIDYGLAGVFEVINIITDFPE